MFENQNNFVKKLFAGPYFDNFERLAIGSYSSNNMTNLTSFGEFHHKEDVAKYVDSIRQASESYTDLDNAVPAVYNKNYASTTDNKITVIFFVSYVDDADVNIVRPHVRKLQDQGIRTVMIGHSAAANIDPASFNITRLEMITNDSNTVFNWGPTKTLPADDYQDWFRMVIDCQAMEITTEKPMLPGNPCGGHIVVVLDASKSWDGFSEEQFNDQNYVVRKLFIAPYFDHYERLALAYYSNTTSLASFGDFSDQSDVANYVRSIERSSVTFLTRALTRVYNNNYPLSANDKLTIVFFVSDIEEYEVQNARSWAQKLQDQGVRLVLVGHGNFKEDYVDVDRLAAVTNDPTTVFKWKDMESLPDDDYQTWFKEVLACPGY
ncbi:hypothetical protein M3Y94_00660500 [Aphelenchoides besseyi]|nr:hypothetical protein M3Y94_00660500 [Aphelenchoides besseyi]